MRYVYIYHKRPKIPGYDRSEQLFAAASQWQKTAVKCQTTQLHSSIEEQYSVGKPSTKENKFLKYPFIIKI